MGLKIEDYAFELIQVSVGTRVSLSYVPSESEWKALSAFSEKQTLAGVMLYGIEHLPREQWPSKSVLLPWIGREQVIEARNLQQNRDTIAVFERLAACGFRCMVLKGQGLAQLYPEPLRRVCGDIDVWVTSHSRDAVVNYLRNKGEKGRVVYHNMPIETWAMGAEVEVHFTPSWMNCWWTNRKLQRWFDGMKDQSVMMTLNPGGELVPVPCLEFNVVFVLQHIYRHLFGSGVGLRQLMDYFYVLKEVNDTGGDIKDHAVETFRGLHMMKFTGAVMWVLQEVFGMPSAWMLCAPDEKEGRWLLSEILRGGNFGHYDDRISIPQNESKVHSFFRITKHNLRLLKHYPEETLWNPLYRAWHYVWRKVKGYPIK